jgi:hypothetical protein
MAKGPRKSSTTRKRRKKRQDPNYYTQAGPVKITQADGTTEELPPYDKTVYAKLIAERWGISSATRRRIWRRDRGSCRYCGEPGEAIDHVVPVAMGGGNRMENLVLACTPCNTRKGASVWTPRPLQ